MQILLAEDHTHLASLTKRALTEDGYMVDVVHDGQSAIDNFEINTYDLVVLDVMLPEVDGIEVCRMIRETNRDIPVIMVTALDGIDDRIKGLDTGADDYLVKPFSFGELSARVRALLRRGVKANHVILEAKLLRLNTVTKEVFYGSSPIVLTAKEYTLLQYFMSHPGEVLSKNNLLEHVWDMNYEGFSNVVETYVRYLRHKISDAGGDGNQIQTIRNLGYKLQS
ncbi:MAG: two component transcriptional regulator, winged helix family [Candidatus Saccharibacteria bacterium]|jgi:two-component system OmpR family response regulator|nr:two component transcriptional regulator, winged helix family [Candidatus Saccharibacteria bacterium]